MLTQSPHLGNVRRLILILFVFFLLFMVLIVRLGYVQLAGAQSYGAHQINLLQKAVEQRRQVIELDDGRGTFVDQNSQALEHNGHQLAEHLIGVFAENPTLVQQLYDQEVRNGLYTAHQLVGISGLQRIFDPFIQGYGRTLLSYSLDGKGLPMNGLGLKYTASTNEYYPMTVKTTLDVDLQQVAERTADQQNLHKGAIVILDAQTSELKAMVSRPNRNLNRLDHSWVNQALERHPPGSIFKIVVAAAALDKGLTHRLKQHYCSGTDPEQKAFHCWLPTGHGNQTFQEAFAQSCNVVFGQLAAQIGPQALQRYAQEMGLLHTNGWQERNLFGRDLFLQLADEKVGQVYTSGRRNKDDTLSLMQTGIGQLDVQVTPLAVANMMATIARGGKAYRVRAIDQLMLNTGATFHSFKQQPFTPSTGSRYVYHELQKLLHDVVQTGTGRHLNQYEWQAAGKTGTAQLSTSDLLKTRAFNHHWFAGYYPAMDPKYVIVTLVMDQQEHASNQAVPIFGDIAEWIDKNKEKQV